ncbi:MAG: hypothetical protein H7Z40_02150 [Phycisphaerae bacterium]|nr:hypothetical protein [Gemmatimonadaceae bacterium]
MLSSPRRWWPFALVTLAALRPIAADAQSRCVVTIGTVEQRDVPLIARASVGSNRTIFADNATCSRADSAPQFSLRAVWPRLRVAAAAGLPAAQEDGAMWSGRGASTALRAGITMNASILHLAIVPEVVTSANRPFDHEPSRDTTRSSFASPYHSSAGGSLDLPKRFGSESYRALTPGASAAWLSAYGVSAGWSAAPQQWGPGQRGSLLLGAASTGIPRIFLRTSAPVATKFGVFDAVAFLGTVTESQFFDRNTDNDFRSLSAFGLSWSPGVASRFTAGMARGVMRTSESSQPKVARAGDAFAKAGNGADELFSAFARVGRPEDALSAWLEVGRNRPGFGLRSFLTLPYDATSYIIGTRGTANVGRSRLVVLAEFANLEQGEDIEGREPRDFYTGAATPQGWTQRGRTIGHWIGPGGQAQFVSLDLVFASSRVGLFVERVRRDEDALFREYLAYPNRHDVSTEIGLRTAIVWHGQEFSLDGSIGKRINFEFQNAEYLPSLRTVDVHIPRIRFSVTPWSQR